MTSHDYHMIKSFEGFALFKCGNKKEDAEDLIQDVFVRILCNKKFDQMQEIEKRKYVVWLIKNESVDIHRDRNMQKRKGVNISLFYENGAMICGPKINPEIFARMELKEVLQKAKGDKFCESLLLLVEGYKNREISKITGKSINTILGRCRYARKYLRKEMKE